MQIYVDIEETHPLYSAVDQAVKMVYSKFDTNDLKRSLSIRVDQNSIVISELFEPDYIMNLQNFDEQDLTMVLVQKFEKYINRKRESDRVLILFGYYLATGFVLMVSIGCYIQDNFNLYTLPSK